MRIVLIGLGVVGQGLLEILNDKQAELAQLGFRPRLVAAATRSRGCLYHPEGLDLPALLAAARRGHLDFYPAGPGLVRNQDILALIRTCQAETLVECSPTDWQSGQPALDYCRAAFASGQHVALANKGPLAAAYDELVTRAQQAGKLLRFEATVMAGTPAIRLAMQALQGCRISEARGILNGTTNYILTQMEHGLDYAAALAEARRLGYAEADPSADVDGWDAAGKALILSRALFGSAFRLDEMQVQGIRHLTSEDIQAARAAGETWKLIARMTPAEASVAPMRVALTGPLAAVSGVMNAVTYVTDLSGEVTLVGPGAGGAATGFGLLSDLLDIHRRV
jgi:homoserine dehydrogenase